MRRYAVESKEGGRMESVAFSIFCFDFHFGFVTRWTPGIRWLFWKATEQTWQLHIGRIRFGVKRNYSTPTRK